MGICIANYTFQTKAMVSVEDIIAKAIEVGGLDIDLKIDDFQLERYQNRHKNMAIKIAEFIEEDLSPDSAKKWAKQSESYTSYCIWYCQFTDPRLHGKVKFAIDEEKRHITLHSESNTPLFQLVSFITQSMSDEADLNPAHHQALESSNKQNNLYPLSKETLLQQQRKKLILTILFSPLMLIVWLVMILISVIFAVFSWLSDIYDYLTGQ